MNQIVKKHLQKVFLLMALLSVLISTNAVSSQAASTKSKAVKAYAAFLSKSKITGGTVDGSTLPYKTKNCYFALAYIDSDSVPELIVNDSMDTFHISGSATIYTYKSGKIKRLTALHLDSGNLGYYKKKGVFADTYLNTGITYTMYGTIKNGSASKSALYTKGVNSFMNLPTIYRAYTGGTYKVISKAKFNSGLKKLVGSTKCSKLVFRKNTKSNRAKYLK